MTSTELSRDPALEGLVCFDLYAASRAVTGFYRPLLGELGLTYPQYLVLVLLQDREAVPVSTVARELHLDHGTLTPLLRRLEGAGHLTRTRSATDERVVEVALTEQGHEVHQRFAAVQCRLGEALGLEEAEFHDLQQMLRRIAVHVG